MSRVSWPEAEEELGPPVLGWLAEWGWECYQEVTLPDDGVADIVATRGPVVWIVELKTSFSLALLDQAFERRRYAHRVSVAVPHHSRSAAWRRRSMQHVMDYLGVGLLSVQPPDPYVQVRPVTEMVPAKFQRDRRIGRQIRSRLDERMKTYAPAGTATGARLTPFRRTSDEVVRVVRHSPGLTLKELVDRIDHHYTSAASARGTIVARIRDGVIPGVRVQKDGRLLRLYPAEPSS